MAESALRKQRGKPFKKGQSGNPHGRPKGCRNRVTEMLQNLIDGQAEGVAQACVKRALGGDVAAMRIILDRVLPVPKDRPVSVSIPPVNDTADIPLVTSALLSACSDGVLTPSEAETIGRLIELHRKGIETADLERRISELEGRF